jgi:hypothetical protein
MSENLLSICAVGCIVVMYFIKPNKPYFDGNILNKVIAKIPFWKTLNNTKSKKNKLAGERCEQIKKISQKLYLHKNTNFKQLKYIINDNDNDYGQFITIDE